MNISFRILLAVYGFCLTILSFITMVVAIRPDIFDKLAGYLSTQLAQTRNASFVLFIIAFIFFSLSITFLLSGFKSGSDKKSISRHTNIGEVNISLGAIENMALAATRRINGVKEAKAYIYKISEGVSVVIKTVITSDFNIPAISEEIQSRVKKSIEDSSGIQVKDVRVFVENISTGYKSRVE